MIKIRYHIEALLAAFFFRLFRILPLDLSSALGAIIARAIAPFFSANRTAHENIKAAFPEKSLRQRNKIRRAMWSNLGRVAAEFSSLPGDRLTRRLSVHNPEILPAPGTAALFFSAHFGNWELLYPMAYDRGVNLSLIYRHINNPYIDKIISDIRLSHCNGLIAKGLRGGVKMLSVIKRGESVAMLADQKLNTGIAVPFFGRMAMTAPAIAEIALKYDIPVIPALVVRRQGAHFDGYLYPPLIVEKTGDHKQDVLNLMTQINMIIENWIRQYPQQWFWVHKRWPEEQKSDSKE